MKLYFSSKIKYAPIWKDLANRLPSDIEINSSWIYYKGQPKYSFLKARLISDCLKEAVNCDILLLYCRDNEHLKGALLEVGAALSNDKVVFCVGDSNSLSPLIYYHKNFFHFKTLTDAIMCILSIQMVYYDYKDIHFHKLRENKYRGEFCSSLFEFKMNSIFRHRHRHK